MRICLFCGLVSVILSFSLFPDTLELDNGDRITGKIVQMNEDTVTVKTEYGTLVIKRAFIKKGLFAMQSTVPRDGLALELLFAGNLSDTSKNNMKVTNDGVTFALGRDGSSSSAISSDGTGKHAGIMHKSALDSLDSFSVSFWFMIINQVKSQYLVSKWDTTTGNLAEGKFAVLYKAGYLTCYAVDGSGTYYTVKSEESADTKSWNHAVFVCDKGNLSLVLNGKKVGEKKYGFGPSRKNESPLFIMTAKAVNDPNMAFYCTEGAIDNLRIYGRPLSDKEIEALFAELSGG